MKNRQGRITDDLKSVQENAETTQDEMKNELQSMIEENVSSKGNRI